MRQPELTALVADRVKLIGVDRQQLLAACAKVGTVAWRRLPFYTSLTLEDQALQDHLSVTCPLDLNGFADVYEEYVAGYLLTSELHRWGPLSWLRQKLRLKAEDATQLFSEAKHRGRQAIHPRNTAHHAVALAALADYTFGIGAPFESGPRTFITSIGGFRFGIAEGKPLSNLQTQTAMPRVATIFCKHGLEHYGRTVITKREPADTTLMSQLHAFAVHHPELFGPELEAFVLALTMIEWRNRSRSPHGLQQAITEGLDPTSVKQALRLVSGFESFSDPYREMKELLVPHIIRTDEFHRLFGHSLRGGPPGALRKQQWRLAIDNLAETLGRKI